MKRFRLPIAALIILTIAAASAAAQVQIDVKTKWGEKKGLTVIKQGVITAIDESGWSVTTEFGEDYALWVKDLKRLKGKKDTVVVRVTLELRTGSLMAEGDLIEKKKVELRYSRGTLDSLLGEPTAGVTADEWLANHRMINEIIALAGGMIPIGGPVAKTVIVAVATQLNEAPEEREIAEAMLLSLKVMSALEQMMPTESASEEGAEREGEESEVKSAQEKEESDAPVSTE